MTRTQAWAAALIGFLVGLTVALWGQTAPRLQWTKTGYP